MNVQKSIFLSFLFISFTTNIHATAESCKKLFDTAAYTQAIPVCHQAAKSGDTESQTLLGEIYDQSGNSDKTAYWWGKAAASGYQPARNLLALKYFYGGIVLGPEKG